MSDLDGKMQEIMALCDLIMEGDSYTQKAEAIHSIADGLIGYEDKVCDQAFAQGRDEEGRGDSGTLDRLHEAICEGRKQDAVDMLNDMFSGVSLRSVKAQNNLFPDRVTA